MSTYKRIVVAVDLSAASDAVMKAAVDLSRDLQAELHVVHVRKIHAGDLADGGIADADVQTAKDIAKMELELERFAAQYAATGVVMTTNVCSGEPYHEINQLVDQTGADMIVMGTHGRTGIAHLVLGSVAENVIRNAKVPVVAIRAPR